MKLLKKFLLTSIIILTAATASMGNTAPVAVAGDDQTVSTETRVKVDGTGSYDDDGDRLKYSWEMTAPAGSTAAFSNPTGKKPNFTADIAGEYTIVLTVTDGTDSDSDTLTVLAGSSVNTPPVADAAEDQILDVASMVRLDGSGSFDVDGDRLTYSWSFTSLPSGSTAVFVDPTSKKPKFTADLDGSYVVQLIVNDGTDSASDLVTITVGTTPPNTPPTADAATDQNVETGTLITLDGSLSSDTDGDPLTYSWTFASVPAGSALIVLTNPDMMHPTFVPDVDGDYDIKLIVNDGMDDSAPATVTVTAAPIPNIPPTADAGTNQSIIEGDTVTLDGSGSSDADGTIDTYAWSEGATPLGEGVTLSISTLSVGIHTITLTVTDNDGASASDDVLVTVTAAPIPNIPPTADAGIDQNVETGTLTTLDGSLSSDADGDPLTYSWTFTSVPAESALTVLTNPDMMHPTFVSDVDGDYDIKLIVNDGMDDSAPATVKVTATTTPNTSLTASDFNMTLDVNESTVIEDWLTLSSADADNDPLTALVKTQGIYGTCVVTDDSLAYLKTIETNATDTCELEISDGTETVQITVTINSLYWKQISAGYYHTVAIKSDGTLWAWGWNGSGQLGDGTTTNSLVPIQESTAATDWSSVSARHRHTIALKDDGTLWAWGYNVYGQLGDGTNADRVVPTQESTAATDWSSVSAGIYHTVGLKDDGTLWAWGQGYMGQLGDGTATNSLVPIQESTAATDWSSVSAGVYHTVAIKDDGTLWAWGRNLFGQLGDGTNTDKYVPTQENTAATNWSSVSCGNYCTVVLKDDGTLWAWGDNRLGQLGDGTTTDRVVPTQENTAATNWSSVSARRDHTVAIKDDGTLWAWGSNYTGQLGDGTATNSLVPIQESAAATDWSSVSAGYGHTIALKDDGTLWAWGYNDYGQLGDGTNADKYVPTQENTAATNWSSVSAGRDHTLAIKDDGTLWAWGRNGFGKLGDGTITNRIVPTQEITAATNWSSVSAGGYHTVAIKDDGTLWAWGRNSYGQLGNETTTDKYVATQEITAATNWSSVSAGYEHTIAIKDDGTLWAWGHNSSGQLGDGTDEHGIGIDKYVPTQEITAATNWSSVSAGDFHTVAIKNIGTLWAWGDNGDGQLGDGTNADKYVPTQEITAATNWSSMSAGGYHTVAIKNTGTLWAWGYNGDGQLGDGTYEDKYEPTQESTEAVDWSSVSAGGEHTLAFKDDGTLWAWGSNGDGKLGDGTTTDRLMATQEITAATNWSSVSTGKEHTMALKDDGTLWAWGDNGEGQLGVWTLVPTLSQPRQP